MGRFTSRRFPSRGPSCSAPGGQADCGADKRKLNSECAALLITSADPLFLFSCTTNSLAEGCLGMSTVTILSSYPLQSRRQLCSAHTTISILREQGYWRSSVSHISAGRTAPELDSSCSSRLPKQPDRSAPLRKAEASQLRLFHALQAFSYPCETRAKRTRAASHTAG